MYYSRWEGNKIEVDLTLPAEDDCRYLLLKVVEQAVRDFINLRSDNLSLSEQTAKDTASGLLFSDSYEIDWGGISLNLERILALWDLEVDWFRDRVRRLERLKDIKNKFITLVDLANLGEECISS